MTGSPELPLRGAVRNEDAYILGKMLDHSAWQRGGDKIVRLITPSDIDAAFDNSGNILFCEFSNRHDRWSQLKGGQRRLYQAAIKGGAHCAVLCQHSVTLADERAICSRTDVRAFEIMLYDHEFLYVGPKRGAAAWETFIQNWFADSLRQRRALLREATRTSQKE